MTGRPGGFQTVPPFRNPAASPIPAPVQPVAAPVHPAAAPIQPAMGPIPTAPAQPRLPSSPAPKPAPSVVGDPLIVSLSQVSQTWPAEVRHDIAGMSLGNARLALPLEEIEQALKSGKVQFQWKQLCRWFEPPVAATPSPAAGEMHLDLPLKIVATLFMARYRPASMQKKSEVGEDIPDLFGKTKTKKSSPPTSTAAMPVRPLSPIAPVSPLPRPLPSPAAGPQSNQPGGAAPAAAPEPTIDLNTLLGPPGHRLPVKEIIHRTARLPGAAGALLAMNDGLLVASAVPSTIKDEVVAAFLPQICGRMNQYAKELCMGGLRAVTLTVEGGHWQILKESNIYFAVLCQPDKAMPLPQLAAIAAELNKQQQ